MSKPVDVAATGVLAAAKVVGASRPVAIRSVANRPLVRYLGT
jgi:hypothetical protein